MSAGGAFGGARGFQPRPPEKGVFPLDHFGECKSVRANMAVSRNGLGSEVGVYLVQWPVQCGT